MRRILAVFVLLAGSALGQVANVNGLAPASISAINGLSSPAKIQGLTLGGGGSAITLVHTWKLHYSGAESETIALNGTNGDGTPTAGNLLTVYSPAYGAGADYSLARVSDNNSGTYALPKGFNPAGSVPVHQYVVTGTVPTITTSPLTLTVDAGASGTTYVVIVQEWAHASGITTGEVQGNDSATTTTSASTPTLTSGSSNVAFLAFYATGSGGTFTMTPGQAGSNPSSGWTFDATYGQETNASTYVGCQAAYNITTGSVTNAQNVWATSTGNSVTLIIPIHP